MKTLLFFPKLEEHKDYHHLPLSALSVSAYLLAESHKVMIFDQRVDSGEKLVTGVVEADQIMISAYSGYQLSQGYQFAQRVKELFPKKKIIWGGPHVTALPEQTLASPYVDEIVCGDVDTGEHPLPYHAIDVGKYINPDTERFAYVTSYSCIGNCTFCQTKPRRKMTFLPLKRIEMDFGNLMNLHQFRECVVFDATLFTKPERALFVSQLMREHKLRWICDSRADEICHMSKDSLKEIVGSGLTQLTVGLESGSPRVVDIMRKGKNHLEHFRRAAERLTNYPLKIVSGVVFGTPGETVDDLQQTIDYIKRIKEINPNFYISTTFFRPLPGTEMTDMAKQYGYVEPQSLAEWAEVGESNHYSYNEYRDAPWIPEPDKHRALYEKFKSEDKEIFI